MAINGLPDGRTASFGDDGSDDLSTIGVIGALIRSGDIGRICADLRTLQRIVPLGTDPIRSVIGDNANRSLRSPPTFEIS
jgi:hypothetical protein